MKYAIKLIDGSILDDYNYVWVTDPCEKYSNKPSGIISNKITSSILNYKEKYKYIGLVPIEYEVKETFLKNLESIKIKRILSTDKIDEFVIIDEEYERDKKIKKIIS